MLGIWLVTNVVFAAFIFGLVHLVTNDALAGDTSSSHDSDPDEHFCANDNRDIPVTATIGTKLSTFMVQRTGRNRCFMRCRAEGIRQLKVVIFSWIKLQESIPLKVLAKLDDDSTSKNL